MNIMEITIAQYHRALKTGEISTRELVKGYLDRIETYDQKGPKLNAIICVNKNVLDEAEALDRNFKKMVPWEHCMGYQFF